MKDYTVPNIINMNGKVLPIPSREEMENEYKEAKKEWAEDKDIGIHSIAGKASKKYGEMENDILIKKAAGIPLEGKEKAVDTAVNKAAPIAADTALGLLVSKIISTAAGRKRPSASQAVAKGNANADTATQLAEFSKDAEKNKKEVGMLTNLGRMEYNKQLIDEGKKLYAEKNPTAKIFYDQMVNQNGLPENYTFRQIGKLNQQKLNLPESYEQVRQETKRLLDNSYPADAMAKEKSIIAEEGIKAGTRFGSKAGKVSTGIGSAVAWLLSPISTFADKIEQKTLREAKKKILAKVSYLNNENIDVSKLSDQEIDAYIEKYQPFIEDWLR